MKNNVTETSINMVFTRDNSANIKKIMDCYKNVLVSGIKGVGKITDTVKAVEDNTNVYYIGNPVDYEGKNRPGSYEKYLKYILSLKKDIKIIKDISKLFKIKDSIILIVDEIYGRNVSELEQIGRLFDTENIQGLQIVGCIKNMGTLINKIDIIIVLDLDGAFTVSKEFGQSICSTLSKK